ncbi:MAG: discoidin domain-containing protein [Mangrovibacterium sp.]
MKSFSGNIILLTFGLIFSLYSCEYEKIVDADYPDQTIYMPAAKNGIYTIDNTPSPTLADPTSGYPYLFVVDVENNAFNIPLAVYRSGLGNKGKFTVNVSVNTDTVASLLASGELSDTEILPSGKYSLASSVDVLNGQETGKFNLSVDLDFLKSNAPGKKYALGVEIDSPERNINPDLKCVVVLIDTKIMIPSANFTYKVDPDDWHKIIFTSTSSYAVSSSWDFGDGSVVTGTSASYTFPDVGVYPVKLTVTGLAGDQSVKSTDVAIFDLANIVNIAVNKPAKTSDDLSASYPARNAVDGVISHASRWVSQTAGEHWIEIDLQQEYNIVSFKTWIGANGTFSYPIPNFSFQAMINDVWTNIVDVTGNSDPQYETIFPVIKTSKVRYFVPDYSNNQVRLYEIAVYALPND